MTQDKLKSTTIRIDLALRDKIKIVAIKKNMKLKDIVNEALKDWLNKNDTI